MASAVSGFMTQFQSDEPMGCYQDFEVADDFVLWGNNMAEMHPVLFSRILEARRNRPTTRIVDIATRGTPTTDYADLHVLIKPGSDLALANGILHLLVASGRIHRAFIAENVVFKRGIEDVKQIGYGCYGDQANRYTFEDQGRDSSIAELETFLRDYTPERVSEISGVPPAQIRALADLYGDLSRGTVSLWCMGVNQHTRGTWMNNLITDLHLMTGKICRPRRQSAQPHRTAERLRHGARGRHDRQPPARRDGGHQSRAPRRGRAHLEAARRDDSGKARVSRRRHVPRAGSRRRESHLDPDDEPLGDVAESGAVRSQAERRPFRRRQRDLSDSHDRGGRSRAAVCRVGGTRRHVRQHRAAHAALAQDGRSAG